MSGRPVFRQHFRGCLSGEAASLPDVLAACERNARAAIASGEALTIALYRYESQLFLFMEALGKPMDPSRLMAPLHPLLLPWPEKGTPSDWAQMYNVFWHSEPRDEDDWVRKTPPGQRRGRIAYLRHDKLFSYVYHHTALVREGLLCGDRYQSIALHEDVLFSYLEEPLTPENMVRDPSRPSEAINAWIAADPESHFLPLPGSEGQNFLFLPSCFAVGRE